MGGIFSPQQIDVDPLPESLQQLRDLLGPAFMQQIFGQSATSAPTFTGLANPVEQLFPGASLNPPGGGGASSIGGAPTSSSGGGGGGFPAGGIGVNSFRGGAGGSAPGTSVDVSALEQQLAQLQANPPRPGGTGFTSASAVQQHREQVAALEGQIAEATSPGANLPSAEGGGGGAGPRGGKNPFDLQQFGGPFSAPLAQGQLDALSGFQQMFDPTKLVSTEQIQGALELGLSGDPAFTPNQGQTFAQAVRPFQPPSNTDNFFNQVFGGSGNSVQELSHGGVIDPTRPTIVGEGGPELIPAGTANVLPLSGDQRGPFGSNSGSFGPFQTPATDGVISSGSRLDQSFQPQFNQSNLFDNNEGPGFEGIFGGGGEDQSRAVQTPIGSFTGVPGGPVITPEVINSQPLAPTGPLPSAPVPGGGSVVPQPGGFEQFQGAPVNAAGPQKPTGIPGQAELGGGGFAGLNPGVGGGDFGPGGNIFPDVQPGGQGPVVGDISSPQALAPAQPAPAFDDFITPILGQFQESFGTALDAPRFDLTETFKQGEQVFQADLDEQLARIREESSRFGLNPGSTDRNDRLLRTAGTETARFRLGQQDLARQGFESAEGRRLGAISQGPQAGNFLDTQFNRQLSSLPFQLQQEQQGVENFFRNQEGAAGRRQDTLSQLPGFSNLPFQQAQGLFDIFGQGRGVADQDIVRRLQEFARTQGGGLEQIIAALSGTPLTNTEFGPSPVSQAADLAGSVIPFL